MNTFLITLLLLNFLSGPGQIIAPESEVIEPYILREEVPILMYHEIGTPAGPWKELYVEPDVFTKQLDWLKENDYSTIKMQDLYEHWYNNRPLPEKPIILTFDDGYRNMYEKVLPLLIARNMQATFFLYPSKLNGPNGLTTEMVATLSAQGMEIGSHTYSHQDLTKVSDKQLVEELANSQKVLEEISKKPVNFLCYPAGRYNPKVIAEAQKYYKSAVTTKYGQASYTQNKYELKRIRINYSDGLNGFIRKITNIKD